MNYSRCFHNLLCFLSKGKVENQYDKGMSLISLCVFLAIPSWPISFKGNVINLNEHHGFAGTN